MYTEYFNLNNNEISKEHLVNKFNMILDNQGRFILNDQKIPLSNEPQRSLGLVQEAWACNFIKKRLQHFCFPVKFPNFLRTSILKNICERLLLFVSPQNTTANRSGMFALDETLTEC